MSRKHSLKHRVPIPSPGNVKDDSTRRYLFDLFSWLEGYAKTMNAYIDTSLREDYPGVLTSLSSTTLPTATYLPFNARVKEDGTFRQINGAYASWALRFDGATDLFEILYAPAGTDPISWTQLWSTSSSGIPTFSQNIRWKSGTAFWGELDHANTANRVYFFPDYNGTVLMRGDDHGLLGGLGDDDHTQYLRTDGTRTLTGNMAASAGVTFDGVDVGSHTHTGAGTNGPQIDHGAALTGLTDDDHSQYALLAGRAGGQTEIGGTAASDSLKLQSTSNATRGNVEVGQGADGALIASGTGKVGFYGTAPVTKTSVSDPAALSTTETADATYDANEVSMLNNLKTDVTNLRTTLLAVVDALQAVGLV